MSVTYEYSNECDTIEKRIFFSILILLQLSVHHLVAMEEDAFAQTPAAVLLDGPAPTVKLVS